MARYIDADKMQDFIVESNDIDDWCVSKYNADWISSFIESQPTADVVEVDKVAEMLRLMFKDDCACNYNRRQIKRYCAMKTRQRQK